MLDDRTIMDILLIFMGFLIGILCAAIFQAEKVLRRK